MSERVRAVWSGLVAACRLMVGVPDYQAYLATRRRFGAGLPVLSRAEFVQRCAERRLGGRNGGRCC